MICESRFISIIQECMKKRKRIILISTSIITILISGFALLNNKQSNDQAITVEKTLIEKQNIINERLQKELSSEIQVYLDPFEISPLTALITFKTEEKVTPTITIKGQYGSPDIEKVFDENTEHFIPVYGLYADSNNTIILSYNSVTEKVNIKTNPVPEDLIATSNITKDPAFQTDDFYFFTPASKGYTSAFDSEGNVRWYLTEKLVWEIRMLNNGNLLLSNETLINPPYYTTGFYELSMLGKISKEYIQPGGYHHDITELPNGNYIVASNDFENDTVEDVIVEIDKDSGDVVKTIDLKEILDMNSGKSENWVSYDWFHNNSVWYDENTNSLTLSGRHNDTVVNLDYDSLEINYIVGDKTNHHEDYQKYFLTPLNDLEWNFAQHAAKILPNGDLFLFDNGINRSKEYVNFIDAQDNYSRGVIYRIDQEAMSIEQIFEYGKDRGSDFYSSYISDVDYLDENHYLIHSGGIAYKDGKVLNAPPGLVESDTLKSVTTELINNEVAFEIELPSNFYRAEKMNIYDNKEYNRANANRVGSLLPTEASRTKLSLFNFSKDISEISDTYSLEIVKESNRLSISGNFDKKDDVSILLKQGNSVNEYDVRISEKPYTAMCIVIFDDKKQSVTKYINDSEDLSGEYSILIKINNKTYATNLSVTYD